MSILKEFKDFSMRGNVIDLAVGVIIGGAFGKIIASLVADVFMPPFGLILGGVNFTDLKWEMKSAIGDQAAVTLNYGKFIQASVEFLIIAFAVFIFVKGINKLTNKKKPETVVKPPYVPSNEEKLLMEIRDLLKK